MPFNIHSGQMQSPVDGIIGTEINQPASTIDEE